MSNILLSSNFINNQESKDGHTELWRYSVIALGETKTNTDNIGFIMNQRIQNINYQQISQIYDLKHTLPRCPIYCGGPVHTEKATVFHSAEYHNSDTQVLTDQFGITFNNKIIQDINRGKGPKHWKVMLGFCMWRDGQLDAEIMRPGGWMEHTWDHIVWSEYKRKDKMWRRLIEKQSQQDANKFLNKVFTNQ